MKTRQIAAWVAAGLMLSTTVLTSCKKDGDNNTLPPIGGFNSSDEVGASSLIAYWPFDGNYTETKQNLTGTNNGATFTTGVKGQAYKGSGGSYVAFSNPGTAFNSLGSYTLSVWINEPAQPVNNTTSSYIAGQGAQGIFFMYDKVADWNLLGLNLEPHRSDTLRVKAGFNNTGASAYRGIVPEILLGGSLNQWIHLAMTYDGASSTYTFYRNGIAVDASSAWGKNASTKVWTDGNKTAPMGNITYKNTPGGFVIGAFPQAVSPKVFSAIDSPQPWSGNFQGSMDELRIYNKALQTSDIGALYQLGQAGR